MYVRMCTGVFVCKCAPMHTYRHAHVDPYLCVCVLLLFVYVCCICMLLCPIGPLVLLIVLLWEEVTGSAGHGNEWQELQDVLGNSFWWPWLSRSSGCHGIMVAVAGVAGSCIPTQRTGDVASVEMACIAVDAFEAAAAVACWLRHQLRMHSSIFNACQGQLRLQLQLQCSSIPN